MITELNNIAHYINKDYEEDLTIADETERASYIIKIETLCDNMKNVINNMFQSSQSKNNVLEPILDVETLTEEQKQRKSIREDDEIIRRNVKSDKENRRCAQEISSTVLSEIESSKKIVLMKSQGIIGSYIEYSKKVFENEIGIIENKVRLVLNPRIKEILDAQDIDIGESIINIYNEYRQEIKDDITARDKFASMIQVSVNPEEAVRTVLEKQEYEEKEESKKQLPGNIIE